MMEGSDFKIRILLEKGVNIPVPKTVYIQDDVQVDRISGSGVTISPGCRIQGAATLILQNTKLGIEGPVTLENCQVGPDVQLRSGYFQNAVFLKGATAGSGSHVREGSILEEQSGIAHTVGLKQTILFPFVQLGSLINFCDCLMAGGTSRKDHSEVGSSYIHFNYSPNQDKATASIIGDVPRGVMLNQRPIFLGGQGGLVGPCRLAFGTIVAAGSIVRKDETRPGRLIVAGGQRSGNIPFVSGMYRSVKRIVENNVTYIADLLALRQWYLHVRKRFVGEDFSPPLLEGLNNNIDCAIAERILRFKNFVEKMPDSIEIYKKTAGENASRKLIHQKEQLIQGWTHVAASFQKGLNCTGEPYLKDSFLQAVDAGINNCGKDYIITIQSLSPDSKTIGTRWLQGIVTETREEVLKCIPSFAISTEQTERSSS
jgi:bifunctional UDP-N-acetylglucosamine pyrophosphorylase / glucosamine-1-phosphate N-acetyltransferase